MIKPNISKIVAFLALLPLSLKGMEGSNPTQPKDIVTLISADNKEITLSRKTAEKSAILKLYLEDPLISRTKRIGSSACPYPELYEGMQKFANLIQGIEFNANPHQLAKIPLNFNSAALQNYSDLLEKKVSLSKLNNQQLVDTFKLAEYLEAPKIIRKKLAKQILLLPKKQQKEVESYLTPYTISINTLIEKEGANFLVKLLTSSSTDDFSSRYGDYLNLSNLNLHSLIGIEKLPEDFRKNIGALMLDNNQLNCIDFKQLCKLFPHLEAVSVKNNQFETLDLNALPSNIIINFENNKIASIKPIGYLSTYPRHLGLKLKNNKLSESELKKVAQALNPNLYQLNKWKLPASTFFGGLICYGIYSIIKECLAFDDNLEKRVLHFDKIPTAIQFDQIEDISQLDQWFNAQDKFHKEFLAILSRENQLLNESLINTLYSLLYMWGGGISSILIQNTWIDHNNCYLQADNQKSIKKKKRNELNMKEVNDSPKTAEDLD